MAEKGKSVNQRRELWETVPFYMSCNMCTVYVQQHVLQLTRWLLAWGEGWRCALFRVIDLWVQNTRVCMPTVRCEPGSNSHVTSLPGKRRSGSPHEGGDKAKKRVS